MPTSASQPVGSPRPLLWATITRSASPSLTTRGTDTDGEFPSLKMVRPILIRMRPGSAVFDSIEML